MTTIPHHQILTRAITLHRTEHPRTRWDTLHDRDRAHWMDRARTDLDTQHPDTDAPALAEGLSERDRLILEIAGRTARSVGQRERVIRVRLGMTHRAFLVRLNALLDDPAALEAAPATVHRLRAQRTSARGSDEDEGR